MRARGRGRAIAFRIIDWCVRFSCINVCVEEGRERDCGGDADDGCQREHKSHHDASKVARDHGVDNDEDVLITEITEAQEDADGEEEDEEIEVHEERGPGSRLMFRD